LIDKSKYDMTVRRVAGIMANHPDRRLSIRDIAGLAGLAWYDVYEALPILYRDRIIGRRKKPGYSTGTHMFTWKIRRKISPQLPLMRSWLEPEPSKNGV